MTPLPVMRWVMVFQLAGFTPSSSLCSPPSSRPDGWAAAGIALSCAGLTGVALWGLRGHRPNWAAIGAALATGLTIAAYTVVDGLGVRASGSSLGYIAGLMAVEGVVVPAYAFSRRRAETVAKLRPFAGLGLLGAALSVGAYGLVLWAQARAALAPIAALRESSVNSCSCGNSLAAQGSSRTHHAAPRHASSIDTRIYPQGVRLLRGECYHQLYLSDAKTRPATAGWVRLVSSQVPVRDELGGDLPDGACACSDRGMAQLPCVP